MPSQRWSRRAGEDADFAAYLTARWPTLVRTVVLLGRDRATAGELVQEALVRCRAEWSQVRESDDVDAHVYAEVLDRHRRRPPRPVPPEVPGEELAEDAQLLAVLAPRLRELPPEQSDPLVLRAVADLTDDQVADVLDLSADSVRRRAADAGARLDVATVPGCSGETPDAVLRRAAGSVEVLGTPIDAVLDVARARRRRRLQLLTAATVGVLAAGLLVWTVVRPTEAETDLGPTEVSRAPNPVDVAWYADGVLHLDAVRVELPQLTEMAELNGGVIYGDEDGVVAFVAADGDRRRLGQKDPDIAFVASADDGWAAWVDPDEDQLVAYDVAAGEQLAGYDLGGEEVRPVAIDQRQVFFDSADGSYSWEPGFGEPEQLDRGGLADVESSTRVYQDGAEIEMVQGFFNISFLRPGLGALLSPGGSYVLTRPPDAAPDGAAYRPVLYDTRTGDPKDFGLEPDELVLDVTFGDNSRVIYLVAPDPGSPADALLVLRTCDLALEPLCSDVSPVPRAEDRPLLAH